IPNPFAKGQKLYRTGDKAKFLENGELEYLGRIDHQVKIRGYRIELGEIENALQGHNAVDSSVVIAHEFSSGDKELVAYFTGSEGLAVEDLRLYLGERLPGYMVPGYYIELASLPLTSNGKVDRKALPLPEAGVGLGSGVEYVAPRDSIELGLVQIWEEILGREGIGIRDN